jgi:TP901 family phage tail tape measure protein
MANGSASSELKFRVGGETRAAEGALINLTERFQQLRLAAKAGIPFPDLRLLETQVKAGLRPMQDLKRALAETIGQAKLANKVEYNPINDERIANAVIKLKELRAAEEAAAASGTKLSNSVGGIGKAFNDALVPLAAIGASLTLALQSFVTSGKEFGDQIRLISTISKESGRQLEALSDQILDAAVALQSDPVDLAAARYEILSSGVTDAAEAFKTMEVSAKLAKAGVGTVAESADLLTSSLNALGGDPTRNAEILFRAVDLGKVKISELAESFGGVAAQAAKAGVSLEEISATVATLSLSGQNASEGLTGIRAILTAVSQQADSAKKEAKRLGIEFNTAAIRAKGLSGFLADVAAKTKGSDESLSKLFGRVEGLNVALSLGGINAKRYGEILGEVRNSTGSLEEAFQRTLNPVDKLTSSFTALRIEAGTRLIKSLAPLLDLVSELLNKLREDKGLLDFAISTTVATAAISSMSATVLILQKALGPLAVAIKAVSEAMEISFIGAATRLGIVVGGVTLAVAGFLKSVNDIRNATELSKRSMTDFNAEIDDATRALVADGKEALKTAKEYDNLSKKVKKTGDDKDRMRTIVLQLINDFPNLRGQLDSVTNGYRSMADAIRNATAAKIAFEEREALDKQIAELRQAKANIESSIGFNANGAGFRVLTPKQKKQIEEIQKREDELLKRRDNIPKTVIERLKQIYTVDNQEKPDLGGKNSAVPDDAELEKIKNARESLARESQKIEENLTGFLKGEIEKRRVVALNDYNERIKKIKELAKAAKQENSPQVIKSLTDAKKVYDQELQAINRDQKRATIEAQLAIETLKAQISQLQASETIGNPFDDLIANADAAQNQIYNTYVTGVRALEDLVRRDPTQKASADQRRAELKQEFEIRTQANKQQFERERAELVKQLNETKQLNLQAAAELGGDQLEIERKNNDRILAGLKARITEQADLLKAALNSLDADPANPALKAGVEKLDSELEATLLEDAKQRQQTAQKTAQIEVDAVQQVIDIIKDQITLLGERPELVQKLIAANVELNRVLLKQRDITGQTAQFRQEIDERIRRTNLESSELGASTDSVSQLLDSLSNLNFNNSGLGNAFQGLFQTIKNLRIEYKKFQTDVQSQGLKGGILEFAKSPNVKKQFADLGNQAINAIGQAFAGSKNQLANSLGNTLSSIASAIQAGPGAPFAFITQGIQNAANESGGFLKKYAAFIDPLGFRKLFGGGSKSALQKAQENLEKTQKFTQQLLKNLDTSDLNSLITALDKVNRFKSGGGAAFQVKKDAADQLKQAIKERKLVIAEAIKDLTFQNAAMIKAFQQMPDTPLENLNIDRDIQLAELTRNRDKALEEYKDSLELQQLIEKNFLLSREALYKQSALDIIDAVIEEQNNIRTLRAQTLQSEAEVSGNQVAVINANLQAQLVAIDNEIAAFKGAEETKTEFLKAKTAERAAIVKQAQDQINDLFREGVDIINEGLVVGETKAQSQKRRLQDLFGTLNPLGLIQQDGNLLQTNITVGSGAIQFTINAVKDAEDLLLQLSSDPVLQARLMAILNIAAVRNA